jgi:hypothetical protein
MLGNILQSFSHSRKRFWKRELISDMPSGIRGDRAVPLYNE